jgi:hypothetical protein
MTKDKFTDLDNIELDNLMIAHFEMKKTHTVFNKDTMETDTTEEVYLACAKDGEEIKYYHTEDLIYLGPLELVDYDLYSGDEEEEEEEIEEEEEEYELDTDVDVVSPKTLRSATKRLSKINQ